jgi:hypothetical protein
VEGKGALVEKEREITIEGFGLKVISDYIVICDSVTSFALFLHFPRSLPHFACDIHPYFQNSLIKRRKFSFCERKETGNPCNLTNNSLPIVLQNGITKSGTVHFLDYLSRFLCLWSGGDLFLFLNGSSHTIRLYNK